MGKITYADKEALNEIPSIADKNKCKASDMNEIKNVVNNLLPDISSQTAPQNPVLNDLWIDTDDENVLVQVDDTVSTTSTNAVQNQAITNYVNGDVLYYNATGTAATLLTDKNPLNYKRVVIYGADENRRLINTTIYPDENTRFQLNIMEIGDSWFAIIEMLGNLTSTGITFIQEKSYSQQGYASSTDLKIVKVIGYNY